MSGNNKKTNKSTNNLVKKPENSRALVKKTKKNQKDQFEEKYLKYVNSTNGLAKLVTKKAITFRITLVLISLGIIVAIYFSTYLSSMPNVFIIPFIPVVLVLFTIPTTIYLVKGLIARTRYSKLQKMVKKLRFEKHEKAYLVRSKYKFYTFLVYDEGVSDQKCLEEVKQVQEIYKELGTKQSFNKVQERVEKLDLTGKLRITDFYTKKISVIKTDEYDFPIVQANVKTPDISSKSVTGISVGNKFVLFPPVVWKSNSNVSNKKVI